MSNLLNESKTEKLAKFFKFSLIVSLVLGAVLFGFLSTNMDSLREPIASELSEITGLPIQLESLNLSLSTGLSLRGNGLKVRSKDESQQIFSAQKIFLDARFKPLLKGQLKIKKIILVNPTMDIVLKPNLESVGSTKNLKNFKTSDQAAKKHSKNIKNSKLDEILENKQGLESVRNLFQKQSTSLRVIEVIDGKLTLHRP
ncbi:uncharacterized protein METZ01_LOCUS202874, partial [marine metagenome]